MLRVEMELRLSILVSVRLRLILRLFLRRGADVTLSCGRCSFLRLFWMMSVVRVLLLTRRLVRLILAYRFGIVFRVVDNLFVGRYSFGDDMGVVVVVYSGLVVRLVVPGTRILFLLVRRFVLTRLLVIMLFLSWLVGVFLRVRVFLMMSGCCFLMLYWCVGRLIVLVVKRAVMLLALRRRLTILCLLR